MGHPFNKSARGNYGKACARSQGSGGNVNSFLSPFFLSPRRILRSLQPQSFKIKYLSFILRSI
ncbi:hypothetical protein, partial [Klebsiella pneumoniae]|uniref:hypothetical protein n=1 Tax=Klebsiella pneumoniae TaxID=573 RepID=UPI001C6F6D3D